MTVLRAKVSFSVGQRFVRIGDVIDESDPILSGREALFEPVEQAASRARANVEQATAAPGEKRSVSRRRSPKRGDSGSPDAG